MSPPLHITADLPRGCRRGFTIVELLVAVLLIDVGVLAMVSATALLARRQFTLRSRMVASQLAANRIQHLLAGACASAAGTVTSPVAIEHWSAALLSSSIRELRDSVVFTVDGGERNVVVRSRSTC